MKKYKVTASYLTFCTLEIEANSEDEAWDIARETDGGDFECTEDLNDWSINEIEEVKQ